MKFHTDKPEGGRAHAKSSSRDIWISKEKKSSKRGVVSAVSEALC